MLSTLDASLRFDSRIYREVNKSIRLVLNNMKIEKKDHEVAFLEAGRSIDRKEVVAYWKDKGISEELKVFRPVVLRQEYPVFFYLSLVLSPNDPTVFMPSPFNYATKGSEGLVETIWLNPPSYSAKRQKSTPGGLLMNYTNPKNLTDRELSNWQEAGRVICHSLLNIGHSVRMKDEPQMGFQSLAHQQGQIVYIPNLKNLQENKNGISIQASRTVKSICTYDETYLGMASVLYVPLDFKDEFIDESASRNDTFAEAVAVFYSPVPNFWDSYLPSYLKGKKVNTSDYIRRQHWKDQRIEKLASKLGTKLSWLRNQIDHYNISKTMTTGNTIDLVKSFDRAFRDEGPAGFKVWASITHQLQTVLKYLTQETEDKSISLQEYITSLIRDRKSVVRDLRNRNMTEEETFRLVIITQNNDGKRYSYVDRLEILHELPTNIYVPLEDKIANFITQEPASNIKQYASKVTSVVFTLTDKYISIKYRQTTKPEAIKKLTGDLQGFKIYYSLLHGFPVPRKKSNHGIGIMLFNALTADMKINKRLYMSADGEKCWTEIWLPIKKKNHG